MAVVRLTSTKSTFEANLIKGALEDEGISCIIQGENFSGLYLGCSNLGPDILVEEEDLETAKAIIQETLEE